MLRGVVEEGSGVEAQVPGYVVAGKTGTAAKPDPVNGGYSDSRYVASFVGFAPARKPRLVVLVTVDEPRGTIWGGTAAAPAFREIAQFALQYLGPAELAPTRRPPRRSRSAAERRRRRRRPRPSDLGTEAPATDAMEAPTTTTRTRPRRRPSTDTTADDG